MEAYELDDDIWISEALCHLADLLKRGEHFLEDLLKSFVVILYSILSFL